MMEQQPHELVWTLATGAVTARCLQVVCELGVADALGSEPASVEELATRCGIDAGALDRVLHLLADQGVFTRSASSYSHTAASQLLRSDHPMSMRAFPRMMGSPMMLDSFDSLAHAVRTGAPGLAQVEPRGTWAYLEARPEQARIFGEAMMAKAAADVQAVLSAYNFNDIGTLADIGGGRGHLLRAVLEAAPDTRGVLVDLPAVIDQLDVTHERLDTWPADFFFEPLPPADAYLLMEVLHDWPDSQAAAILTAIRQAAPPGARVLVIENILEDNRPDIRGHILDVIMLTVTGGSWNAASPNCRPCCDRPDSATPRPIRRRVRCGSWRRTLPDLRRPPPIAGKQEQEVRLLGPCRRATSSLILVVGLIAGVRPNGYGRVRPTLDVQAGAQCATDREHVILGRPRAEHPDQRAVWIRRSHLWTVVRSGPAAMAGHP